MICTVLLILSCLDSGPTRMFDVSLYIFMNIVQDLHKIKLQYVIYDYRHMKQGTVEISMSSRQMQLSRYTICQRTQVFAP